MAQNFPGPFEIELFYTVGSFQHVQRLNVDVPNDPAPGTAMADIDVVQRNAVEQSIQAKVDAWVALLAALINDGDSFDSFNLWKYTPLTFDRTFIAADTLGDPGLNAGAATESHQSTMTFRTQEGNPMRIVLLEAVHTGEDVVPYATAPALFKDIMDLVDSDAGFILARDTSYPIAKLNVSGGQNEALFKRHHR